MQVASDPVENAAMEWEFPTNERIQEVVSMVLPAVELARTGVNGWINRRKRSAMFLRVSLDRTIRMRKVWFETGNEAWRIRASQNLASATRHAIALGDSATLAADGLTAMIVSCVLEAMIEDDEKKAEYFEMTNQVRSWELSIPNAAARLLVGREQQAIHDKRKGIFKGWEAFTNRAA